MNRILTLLLAAAGLVLASCESTKSKPASGSCCAEGASAGGSCCAEGSGGTAHKH